ncbi:leucine-rich repeat domain-containing protein [Treponema phagedenis]|uniref:leucine-rich repeat domain-containing protein n=1 Tax=Treponema phagedenis TaxID=162 RepID=UPI0011ED38A9|nr:leucine-rich repeat domain-containing protein [Treponema phagedenis]TYT77793.1 hypothetical protein FS559_00960 [Treponema phagedenis]TYT78084.1 hypothetical protein FS559_02545 [Treponema phagedenis]
MDKIRMRTNAGSINLRVTTKDDSPCELWNGGKKIAELQSDNKENIAVQNKAEEIIIKGYDIQELGCQYNQLTTLNASGCTSLQWLYCYNNQLTTLNVSGLTSLEVLSCFNNQLTSLAVSGLTSLQWLDCYDNQLTTLNASGLTSLRRLSCFRNQLTALDVSSCTSLQWLYCSNNQLTTLNASGCTSLQVLGCEYSPFTAEDLKKLFEDLPERKEKDGGVLLYKDGDSNYKDFTQPPELAAAFKAAKAKGWRLYKINNDDLMEL